MSIKKDNYQRSKITRLIVNKRYKSEMMVLRSSFINMKSVRTPLRVMVCNACELVGFTRFLCILCIQRLSRGINKQVRSKSVLP